MTFQLTDSNISSAVTSTTPSTSELPDHAPQFETLRHIIIGSLSAVQITIKSLHKHGYAESNDWSKPLPTGRPDEVMAILTKRIRVEGNG